jgi:transcriptional regulator with XRE-family HTH domain
MNPMEVGRRLKSLRVKAKLGLRELSRKAEIAPASLSAIEKGRSSPALATLQKVLEALDTDFPAFFAGVSRPDSRPVSRAAEMKVAENDYRKCVFCPPKGSGRRFGTRLETISPLERNPVWKKHKSDFAGIILAGGPVKVEIGGLGEWKLKKGDSYYVRARQRYRATNLGKTPMTMITIWEPPVY